MELKVYSAVIILIVSSETDILTSCLRYFLG